MVQSWRNSVDLTWQNLKIHKCLNISRQSACKAVSFITSSQYCWNTSLEHLYLWCTCSTEVVQLNLYLILKSEDTPVCWGLWPSDCYFYGTLEKYLLNFLSWCQTDSYEDKMKWVLTRSVSPRSSDSSATLTCSACAKYRPPRLPILLPLSRRIFKDVFLYMRHLSLSQIHNNNNQCQCVSVRNTMFVTLSGLDYLHKHK